MIWIIKRGQWDYAFAGAVKDGRITDWTDDQTLAHRFADRNEAANIVGHTDAADGVRVVRLVRRGKGEP